MNICYIIASYGGDDIRSIEKNEKPPRADYLKIHLSKLLETDLQQISKVLLVKANCKTIIPGFYELDDSKKILGSKFVELEVQNQGLSYGQWIAGINRYPDFDFYILVEDDYYPSIPDFVNKLLDLYQQKVNSCGYLASYCSDVVSWYPYHAAVSNGILDRAAAKKLREPNILSLSRDEYSKTYPNNVCDQVAFSNIFKDNLISMSPEYSIPFWSSSLKKIVFMEKEIGNKEILFKPVQMHEG